MPDRYFQLRSYLSYWLDAVDEHSLHSPFFYDFYLQVVKSKRAPAEKAEFEKLRKRLLQDRRLTTGDDPGSGHGKGKRSVAEIARTSLSPAKFSMLYWRLIRYMKAKTAIELGTSLGINALYLADPEEVALTTFEGAPDIADIASLTFEFAGAKNISLVRGNIDRTLPAYLSSVRKIDFVLIDANHRYQPALKYFEQILSKVSEKSVVVMDDIYYSSDMQRAWQVVKKHRLVYASADLFRCGILFFDPSLNKQHVILQV